MFTRMCLYFQKEPDEICKQYHVGNKTIVLSSASHESDTLKDKVYLDNALCVQFEQKMYYISLECESITIVRNVFVEYGKYNHGNMTWCMVRK